MGKETSGKAAMIESDFVNNVAFIMDKHFPSSEETGVLKCMLKIDVFDSCYVLYIFCIPPSPNRPYIGLQNCVLWAKINP